MKKISDEKLLELEKDFKEMLDKVNIHSYDPLSTAFQRFLNIALAYSVLKDMQEDKGLAKKYKSELDNEEEWDDFMHADSELDGAEEYLHMYKETKNPTLKSMASSELNHSHFFLDKIRLMHKTPEEQTKYNDLLARYNAMVEKINK